MDKLLYYCTVDSRISISLYLLTLRFICPFSCPVSIMTSSCLFSLVLFFFFLINFTSFVLNAVSQFFSAFSRQLRSQQGWVRDPLVMGCWTVLLTDLGNRRFLLWTLSMLSVLESLRGFQNYPVDFNLRLSPILSLKFNIFIQNSYQNAVTSKKGDFHLYHQVKQYI